LLEAQYLGLGQVVESLYAGDHMTS